MCSKDKSVNVIIALTIIHLMTLGCYLASIFGNTWFIINENNITTTKGLLTECTDVSGKKTCKTKSDLFEFNKGESTDPILTCTILSAFFILLTLTCLLPTLCCCQAKAKLRRKFYKYAAVISLVSAICIVDGMIYAEIELKNLFDKSEARYKNWSYLISWVGAGLQLLTLTLNVILVYVRPKNRLQAY